MQAQAASMVKGRNGVLQVVPSDSKKYYVAADVMKIHGVSRPKAYKMIREAREELIAQGKLLEEYPCGKIPKKYFDSRTGND